MQIMIEISSMTIIESLIFMTFSISFYKVVKEMSKKIYSQMETTIVLNNLQESIIIKSDQKIEFVNHNFI